MKTFTMQAAKRTAKDHGKIFNHTIETLDKHCALAWAQRNNRSPSAKITVLTNTIKQRSKINQPKTFGE